MDGEAGSEASAILVAVLADGMGGHAKGDVASQMIVESMKKVHEGVKLDSYIDDIEERLLEAGLDRIREVMVSRISPTAAALSEPRDTLEDVYEPYLLQQGFVGRTPRGRIATRHAYAHLGRPAPMDC